LIAISDTTLAPAHLLVRRFEHLAARAAPGSLMVQLRDLQLKDRERLELGRTLRDVTRRHDQALAVNDRADLALLIEADGLHLGEASVAVPEARKLVGGLFISRARHDPARAGSSGADAELISPIFAERKGRPALGIEAVERARSCAGGATLIYALGGVDAQNAARCLAAGADGVAVMGAVLDGRDPDPLLWALGILL
jgi:thiamine-phosphate pyrophosphorylase